MSRCRQTPAPLPVLWVQASWGSVLCQHTTDHNMQSWRECSRTLSWQHGFWSRTRLHLFAPDCEDMPQGRPLNFAFLRFPGLSSLCPDGFHRNTVDFPLPPVALNQAHLFAIFSQTTFFPNTLAKARCEHRRSDSCLTGPSKLLSFLPSDEEHRQAFCQVHVRTDSKCHKKPLCTAASHLHVMYKHHPKLSAIQVPAKWKGWVFWLCKFAATYSVPWDRGQKESEEQGVCRIFLPALHLCLGW